MRKAAYILYKIGFFLGIVALVGAIIFLISGFVMQGTIETLMEQARENGKENIVAMLHYLPTMYFVGSIYLTISGIASFILGSQGMRRSDTYGLEKEGKAFGIVSIILGFLIGNEVILVASVFLVVLAEKRKN